MAPSNVFNGQLPLMQVSRQHPSDDHQARQDAASFRLQFHTFVDNSSTALQSTNIAPPITSRPPNIQPVPAPAYKRILFTSANVPGQPVVKNDGGNSEKRKRKKRRTTHHSENTRLKTSDPDSSSSGMHADAWSIILAHTRPGFLLQMRTVSKFFYHITNTDTIWRDAREHHFGSDMPSRPPALTERQYACLLDGRGCQNPQCERRETRKVRWVFRLRLCDDCLSRKLDTYKPDNEPSPQSRYASMFQTPADRDQYGTGLIDLLPTSTTWGYVHVLLVGNELTSLSGRPSSPRVVNRESGKWIARSLSASPLVYLKSDYATLQREYQTIQLEDWEPQRVFEWTKEKYINATAIARAATDIESWEFQRVSDQITFGSLRNQRQEFFARQASRLTPPMSEDMLLCFAAYHTALASSNPPTERSWETLLAKILPYRPLALEVIQYMSSRFARFGRTIPTSPEMTWFDGLHDRRRRKKKETGKWSNEQQFVLDLAEEQFNKLIGEVADEDLLLLCLRNTYDAYQELPSKPEGLNFDGNQGEYRLSLDDAKMIVEEIIEKQIKKSTLRGVRVLESLRCMGCTRFTSGKRYSFQSAFEHMFDKHSKLIGKDLHFHRFLKYFRVPQDCLSKDYRFPWFLVEWTKSLPLLPTHAEVTAETRWIPDEDVPYVQLSKPGTKSAFEGRQAVPQDKVASNDFVTNFVHAVKTMSATRLDSECVVKIAIKYGKDLAAGNEPSIAEFFECIRPSQELGSGLIFKFRCGVCNRRPDVNSHLRCVKHSVEVNILRKHWDDKHVHENLEWSTNFMDLPSDTALLEIMLSSDEKLRKDQANSIERETIGLRKSVKKIADQKAAALMQKETAMDTFNRLFFASETNLTEGNG